MVVMVNPDNMKHLAFVFKPDDVKARGFRAWWTFICQKCSDNTFIH
jgi:hypothetical protein